MSQHDMVLDNGPGLAVRTDMNAAIQALVSTSSGPVEPTVKFPGMLWLDTSVAPDGLIKQRNLANDAWITLRASASTPGEEIHAAPEKLVPIDADEVPISDSASTPTAWQRAKVKISTIKTTVLNSFAALTAKTTLVDADLFVISDSAAAGAAKKHSWANMKAALSTGTINTAVLTTSGTWTKPAGLKYLHVVCVGAGGASQNTVATGAGVSAASGGGGGGGTAIKLFAASSLAASVAYTVGAATASTFSGLTGGAGATGAVNTGGGSTFLGSAGGAGGTASGGEININGGNGGQGLRAGHNSAANAYAGDGGGSWLSPSQPGIWSANMAGVTGAGPGGGARGACVGPSTSGAVGAAGAAGIIILKEYF